MKISLS